MVQNHKTKEIFSKNKISKFKQCSHFFFSFIFSFRSTYPLINEFFSSLSLIYSRKHHFHNEETIRKYHGKKFYAIAKQKREQKKTLLNFICEFTL